MPTKETVMEFVSLLPSFYVVRRVNGWHGGTPEFYHRQKPGTFYHLDEALEWEYYENGKFVRASQEKLPQQAPGPKKPEVVTSPHEVRELLWWEQESAARHAQLVALVKLRNEVRDAIRFGEL